MTLRVSLIHENHYSYSQQASSAHMYLCLEPRTLAGQIVEKFEFEIDPSGNLFSTKDGFGNERHVLLVTQRHASLHINTRAVICIEDPVSVLESQDGVSESMQPFGPPPGTALLETLMAFTELTRPTQKLEQFVKTHGIEQKSTPMESITELELKINQALEYKPGITTYRSPAIHALETGQGVCQDFAHVAIAILRKWRIPARYVSGYVCDQSGGEMQIGMATHAWAEAWLPRQGWARLDATNPVGSGAAYVRIGYGRDYNDIPPTKGIASGSGDTKLEVHVSIKRAGEERT